MDANIAVTDSLITFKNTRGAVGRGTLVHVTRNLAVFEVYNPYSIVQMSEVLNDLQILRGDRKLYSGRAVVSNLVATGLMVIVSATLVDPWSDLAGVMPGQGLKEEVEQFIKGWEVSHRLQPKYMVAVSNLRSFLIELARWLEQAEVASVQPADVNPEKELEYCVEIEQPLAPKITELFFAFEHEAGQVALEESMAHRAHTRRELHPLMLCSPFVHRSYTKPLGYAGDYQMVNMMLNVPREGPSTYAKIVNTWCLRQGAPAAHRNRITMLEEHLHNETERMMRAGKPLRILNVGCGPAVEIQNFIRTDSLSDYCEFTLMDFNEETIAYAERNIKEAIRSARRQTKYSFIHKSVDDLLKEVAGLREGMLPATYDYVYCAGLFDYLSDRTCKRLMQHFYNLVTPGGLVCSTNVHKNNPVRFFMEHIMEWHLIYRDEAKMQALAPEGKVRLDVTGINVFLDVRKPEA